MGRHVALARRLVRDEVPNCRLSTSRGLPASAPDRRTERSTTRPRDGRPPPLPARACCRSRRARARRPASRSPHQRASASGRAAAHRSTAAATGCHLFQRCRRPSPYARQGNEPAPAARSYLAERRPAQDRPAAPGDAADRSHPVHGTALTPPCSSCGSSTACNRASTDKGKQWGKYTYVKLTTNERFPQARGRRAPALAGAMLHRSLAVGSGGTPCHRGDRDRDPLRRCSAAPGRCDWPALRPAQLGVSTCLRAQGRSRGRSTGAIVDRTVRGITTDAELLLDATASADDRARRCRTVRGSRRRARSR